MKTNFIILLFLFAGAGIKAKACDACNACDACDACNSYSSPKGLVKGPGNSFILTCTQNLFTDKITCKIPEKLVDTLKSSRLLSQVVVNQNKQTLFKLIFKSSKIGAIMGAIIGSLLGVGNLLYRVVQDFKIHPTSGQIQKKAVIDYLSKHREDYSTIAYTLSGLLFCPYLTEAVEQFSNLLLTHAPFLKNLRNRSEYLWVKMISGIIPWTLGGLVVGVAVGLLGSVINPQQAVYVVLTVAHDYSTDNERTNSASSPAEAQ